MRKNIAVAVAIAGVVLSCGVAAAEVAQEKTVTLADQLSVALTIYHDDLALVTDRRRVVLDGGENRLAFREVSDLMIPETASLASVNPGASVVVREQSFDFDLLTPEALLQHHVGRSVRVVQTHPMTGEETQIEAQLLAVSGGVVLRIGDRIETGVPGRIVFPGIPEGVRERPTLTLHLSADASRPHDLELRYLSGGLSWKTDYVADFSPDGGTLDLSGWVTLVNRSGTRYRDARLQLVAGDVHRVRDEMQKRMDFAPRELMAAAAPSFREEGLFEYHLYTLDRPTTIEENETKQVLLLTAGKVPLRREYLLAGQDYYYRGRHGELGRNVRVAAFAEFDNRLGELGIPLPGGVVRAYQSDAAGRVQFIGEDRIDHTPEGEAVRLRLGDAFDLVADRTQTDFRRVPTTEREGQIFETAFRIELRNAKKEGVTVTVTEPLTGDWEILSQSHPHEKNSAREALWRINVPAQGRAVLEYRVRVRL